LPELQIIELLALVYGPKMSMALYWRLLSAMSAKAETEGATQD
jgi:hypothetical protein